MTSSARPSWRRSASVASAAAAKARKLASTPLPPARIASSKAARGNGSAPEPASAPKSEAEITEPFSIAMRSMSNITSRSAAICAAASTSSEEAMPSPGTIFSLTASARWVEAISVVRSGVTKPRMMARPASIISAAISTSTSPGAGASENTGMRAPAGAIST